MSKSFPNNLIKIPIGVTIIKNINAIIIGEIILPKSNPNFNHNLLTGLKIFEFNKPKTKKINDNKRDHNLIF